MLLFNIPFMPAARLMQIAIVLTLNIEPSNTQLNANKDKLKGTPSAWEKKKKNHSNSLQLFNQSTSRS